MADSPKQGDPPWWYLEKLPGGEVELTVGRAPYRVYRLGGGCFGLFALGLTVSAALWSDEPWGLFEIVGLSIGSLALLVAWLVGREGESWLLSPGRATRLRSPQGEMTDFHPTQVRHEVWHDSDDQRCSGLSLVAGGAKVPVASIIPFEDVQLELGRAMASALGVELVQGTRE